MNSFPTIMEFILCKHGTCVGKVRLFKCFWKVFVERRTNELQKKGNHLGLHRINRSILCKYFSNVHIEWLCLDPVRPLSTNQPMNSTTFYKVLIGRKKKYVKYCCEKKTNANHKSQFSRTAEDVMSEDASLFHFRPLKWSLSIDFYLLPFLSNEITRFDHSTKSNDCLYVGFIAIRFVHIFHTCELWMLCIAQRTTI